MKERYLTNQNLETNLNHPTGNPSLRRLLHKLLIRCLEFGLTLFSLSFYSTSPNSYTASATDKFYTETANYNSTTSASNSQDSTVIKDSKSYLTYTFYIYIYIYYSSRRFPLFIISLGFCNSFTHGFLSFAFSFNYLLNYLSSEFIDNIR